MAFSSHYVFLHYITLHYIYVTLHHVTSHYIYLYVFIFNLGAILFFHTKLIVQAYGQLGHRVQDSAVCSGLTHLIRGSLRGFSPAGQSLTSSEVDKVIAQPLATVRGETLHLVRSVRQAKPNQIRV